MLDNRKVPLHCCTHNGSPNDQSNIIIQTGKNDKHFYSENISLVLDHS